MDKKTFIIITPGFPEDENDSTCLPTQQLFVRRVKLLYPDLRLVVISLQYPSQRQSYRWHGVEVIPCNIPARSYLSRLFYWLQTFRMLKIIYQQSEVIGVLAFWCNEAALLGSFFSRPKKIPFKIWVSGQDAKSDNRFVKFIRPSGNELVAMSDFLQTRFESSHGIKPFYVIPNAILPPANHTVHRDIDIISVGSLIALKQLHIAIEVVYQLKQDGLNPKVIIVGDGPQKKELCDLISLYNLQHNVMMKGQLNHAEVLLMMSRAKLLLHPSSYEGYSTVCLEALASGCHVISFTHAELQPIEHWHLVTNIAEMKTKAMNILKTEKNYSPIVVHHIDDTVRAILALYELPDQRL